MDNQKEFATAMKARLAAEIGNLFIAVVEAQAARDVAVMQIREMENLAKSDASKSSAEESQGQ